MILPLILSFVLSRKTTNLVQHILNENSVSRGGVVDQDVRHRTDELARGNAALPFWIIGLPLTSVVNKGQQIL
jgi:hypothetical protein